jgi:AraC-like DNA-binding protein
MDVLSSILDSVKLKAVVYQQARFTTQWGIQVAQDENSQFWRLLKGTCYIVMPGEEIIKMNVGDFVFIPHGSSHIICSKPGTPAMPSGYYVKMREKQSLFEGDEEETVLIGGHFEFSSATQHPFLTSLPQIIQVDKSNVELNLWMQNIASFMNEEVCSEGLGSKVLLSRLAEILFILIIRSYLTRADIAGGFLMALKDERISSSLKVMHEQPDKAWTLDQLASAAGMSRSLYAKEFKRLAGDTPLGYLTDWRMLKAKEFLLDSRKNVSEVAGDVGYQSEAAFTRIFKSKVGQTPAGYRRRMMA